MVKKCLKCGHELNIWPNVHMRWCYTQMQFNSAHFGRKISTFATPPHRTPERAITQISVSKQCQDNDVLGGGMLQLNRFLYMFCYLEFRPLEKVQFYKTFSFKWRLDLDLSTVFFIIVPMTARFCFVKVSYGELASSSIILGLKNHTFKHGTI